MWTYILELALDNQTEVHMFSCAKSIETVFSESVLLAVACETESRRTSTVSVAAALPLPKVSSKVPYPVKVKEMPAEGDPL